MSDCPTQGSDRLPYQGPDRLPYQDSIGRNADVGDSPFAGLLLTEGCADRVGLSDRVRVVGELARVQPRVARIAANKRTVDERVAMLSILTPSPN